MGLFVDADGSSDAAAQIDDYVFRLGEDGSPQVFAGDGSGEINSPAFIKFSGQVAATPTWSAEFRILATSLMLWNGPFGVAVSHRAGTDDRYWPYAAEDATPSSWAAVAFEMAPYVNAIKPGSVTAGDQGVVLDGRRCALWGSGCLALERSCPDDSDIGFDILCPSHLTMPCCKAPVSLN